MEGQRVMLRQLNIFKNAPTSLLDKLERLCFRRAFSSGEMIYFRGGESQKTFLILSGEVRRYHAGDGRKIVLEVLKAGDFFGNLSAPYGRKQGQRSGDCPDTSQGYK